MELTSSKKFRNQCEFERFCKTVICGARCDYLRMLSNRAKHESPFSEFSTAFLDSLSSECADPSAQYVFKVYGQYIPLSNERLIEALLELDTRSCNILLLAYSLGLSDRKIAILLGVSRSKIQRDRIALFTELKKRMEG